MTTQGRQECGTEGGLGALEQPCPPSLHPTPQESQRLSVHSEAWWMSWLVNSQLLSCHFLCFPDVWCLLLLSSPTQQRLLWYWRDIPLLLLPTAKGKGQPLSWRKAMSGHSSGESPCWAASCPLLHRAMVGMVVPLAAHRDLQKP